MDHRRLLGLLFLIWALIQAVIAVGFAVTRQTINTPYPVLYWVTTVLMILAFAYTGWRLRVGDPRARFLAIVLSAVSLIAFPVGTVLGIYGLFAMLRRPRREATA